MQSIDEDSLKSLWKVNKIELSLMDKENYI